MSLSEEDKKRIKAERQRIQRAAFTPEEKKARSREYLASLTPEQLLRRKEAMYKYRTSPKGKDRRVERIANRSPENVERDLAIRRAYEKTPERIARAKQYKKADRKLPDRIAYNRAYGIKLRYGMTIEQWESMFDAQGRCCAICKSPEPGALKGWHTDHCHTALMVRGILCQACNLGLGKFKDNSSFLQSAVKYLETK